MSFTASIRQSVFVSLTLAGLAAAWWGCSGAAPPATTHGSGGSAGAGTGGTGGTAVDADGGKVDAGICKAMSYAALPITVDIIFLIDESGSMEGPKWTGTKAALKAFFNDPASSGIGAGLNFLPNHFANICDSTGYEGLVVPIAVLPGNAFALSNAIPADATLSGTPMYAALQGTLKAATAYQDAHPQHKVVVVLATDGDPYGCTPLDIPSIASVAQAALNYDGVRTYVIGCMGATIANLNQIAAAGGTTAAYDVTNDITQFSAAIGQIRSAELGCDFQIPPAPTGQIIDPDKVNFSYTPKGVGNPVVLPRAKTLADCNGNPGWYYDNNTAPTKIVLCPTSCATVQADTSAKVNVLYGCESMLN